MQEAGVVSGSFSLTDADGSGDSFISVTGSDLVTLSSTEPTTVVGDFGSLEVDLSALTYVYTLDSSVTSIASSESLPETFTFITEEGVSADLVIMIDGVNDPSPVLFLVPERML